MAEKSTEFDIKVFAYCIMDNHFHIALENSSGNLSQFMRSLNGHFGNYYRKLTNSKGYVFEDRFKSTLIQDESYLVTLLVYILQNPVRSFYVENAFEYPWSSACEYFNNMNESFIEKCLVEEFFISRNNFMNIVNNEKTKILGEQIIGNSRYLGDKMIHSNLDEISDYKNIMLPMGTKFSEVLVNLVHKFETNYYIKLSSINLKVEKGKKTRRLFLVFLRENGFTYNDISKINIFSELNVNSLRVLYHREKKAKSLLTKKEPSP